MEKQKYYLGLDMGTSSVGWAVTNSSYELIRKKGKDMWGVREFDPANTAAERRFHRADRRRRQRQVARLGLLKEYFGKEIEKIDENFFVRLENSKYYAEDKDQRLLSKNGIFNDANYKDADYYSQYPTIFHLRKDLLDIDNTGKIFDVRLVYLALANMFKHRGHFLLSTNDDALNMAQVDAIYQDVLEKLSDDYGIRLEVKPIQDVIAIVGDYEIGRKRKQELMMELFDITRAKKSAVEFLKCMCGLSVNVRTIFDEEVKDKVSLCFHDFSYADKIPELMDQLTETEYSIIE